MSKDRYKIEICEAENGFVVCWSQIGYPDEGILLCPTVSDVTVEIERITELLKTIDRNGR
ncbi:hypothetical protein LCGC14_2259830 [marine sediment metagenome]|uniref:Uncharacterized protein n=1 Tax=marine sediment metagenome TaxID=412755 RepID=A0A0F9FV19_9ZZZZ